jgi:hypothetical protein
MSSTQMGPLGTTKIEKNIAHSIAQILRQDYADSGAAIKRIERKAKLSPHAIKNWYEGRKVPSLENFICLTKASPGLVEWFLRQTKNDDLADLLSAQIKAAKVGSPPLKFEFYSINFDTIKTKKNLDILQNLNQRQMCFYSQVRQGRKPTAHDMTNFWNIGIATAKRDIAGLIDAGLICFVGPKRTGYYAAL